MLIKSKKYFFTAEGYTDAHLTLSSRYFYFGPGSLKRALLGRNTGVKREPPPYHPQSRPPPPENRCAAGKKKESDPAAAFRRGVMRDSGLVLLQHVAHDVHGQEHGPIGRHRAQEAGHEAAVETDEPAVGVELAHCLRDGGEGPLLGDHAIGLDRGLDDVERVQAPPVETPASPPAAKMCVTGKSFRAHPSCSENVSLKISKDPKYTLKAGVLRNTVALKPWKGASAPLIRNDRATHSPMDLKGGT